MDIGAHDGLCIVQADRQVVGDLIVGRSIISGHCDRRLRRILLLGEILLGKGGLHGGLIGERLVDHGLGKCMSLDCGAGLDLVGSVELVRGRSVSVVRGTRLPATEDELALVERHLLVGVADGLFGHLGLLCGRLVMRLRLCFGLDVPAGRQHFDRRLTDGTAIVRQLGRNPPALARNVGLGLARASVADTGARNRSDGCAVPLERELGVKARFSGPSSLGIGRRREADRVPIRLRDGTAVLDLPDLEAGVAGKARCGGARARRIE